jgi:hypothetical protein
MELQLVVCEWICGQLDCHVLRFRFQLKSLYIQVAHTTFRQENRPMTCQERQREYVEVQLQPICNLTIDTRRQTVSIEECQHLSTRPHGIESHMTVFFIGTTLRTSNLTRVTLNIFETVIFMRPLRNM